MQVFECVFCKEPITRQEGEGPWVDVQNSKRGAQPVNHVHSPNHAPDDIVRNTSTERSDKE